MTSDGDRNRRDADDLARLLDGDLDPQAERALRERLEQEDPGAVREMDRLHRFEDWVRSELPVTPESRRRRFDQILLDASAAARIVEAESSRRRRLALVALAAAAVILLAAIWWGGLVSPTPAVEMSFATVDVRRSGEDSLTQRYRIRIGSDSPGRVYVLEYDQDHVVRFLLPYPDPESGAWRALDENILEEGESEILFPRDGEIVATGRPGSVEYLIAFFSRDPLAPENIERLQGELSDRALRLRESGLGAVETVTALVELLGEDFPAVRLLTRRYGD